MFQTPILVILFNRPACAVKVFDKLKKLKPAELYIAADGPRENVSADIEKCKATRKIFDNINWDCKVTKLFQEKNLGCKVGVSSAITWFFENVNEGIILEDDIVPDLSFFPFCENLLNFYRNDTRVMMISGFNHHNQWETGKYSYFFSFYGGVWGWATWRRAWRLNDLAMNNWGEIKSQSVLKKVLCQDDKYIKCREDLLNIAFKNKVNTWDYQWSLSRIANSGLSIIPVKNMINNIGFGVDATHTYKRDNKEDQFLVYKCNFPLIHNPFVIPDRKYDDLFMKNITHENTAILKIKHFLYKIYGKLFK